ncbi:glycerophosphodiester phosphodiesterase [Marininema halotolerans]|uniref:Glycerophosphoryl diester phosphodiesterase n=1 Tax=Marininema halotolerans TaxID=1155944 RepID=A0A1I6QAH8_9BACL|nr:glycerophosphodiester phosphodiesterase [Marininema halotolerans]SFS49477.1 glycerophosphoryl diester phosphodiesterase [Marininema halotolerans]
MAIQIYAHRGYSAIAPENTMIAFQKAVDAGAHGLELDVHLTKDHEMVVIHDETLQRTTNGRGRVRNLSLEEVRRVDAGSWFGDDFQGERVPLLSEVVALAARDGLSLNIELKNNKIAYEGLERQVIAMLEDYDMINQTVISCFDHYSLRRVKEVCPKVDTAILYMANLFEPWEYARHVGVTSIHPYRPTVTREMLTKSHALNLPVRPFTINQEKEMRRLIDMGVDALITDNVKEALNELKNRG